MCRALSIIPGSLPIAFIARMCYECVYAPFNRRCLFKINEPWNEICLSPYKTHQGKVDEGPRTTIRVLCGTDRYAKDVLHTQCMILVLMAFQVLDGDSTGYHSKSC